MSAFTNGAVRETLQGGYIPVRPIPMTALAIIIGMASMTSPRRCWRTTRSLKSDSDRRSDVRHFSQIVSLTGVFYAVNKMKWVGAKSLSPEAALQSLHPKRSLEGREH
jgi:hypothetical protein